MIRNMLPSPIRAVVSVCLVLRLKYSPRACLVACSPSNSIRDGSPKLGTQTSS